MTSKTPAETETILRQIKARMASGHNELLITPFPRPSVGKSLKTDLIEAIKDKHQLRNCYFVENFINQTFIIRWP